MLSPSACRMGLVSTTRRKIGTSVAGQVPVFSRRPFLTSFKPSSSSLGIEVETGVRARRSSPSFKRDTPVRRWKSTRVAPLYDADDSDGDELEVRTKGFAAAAQLRATEKLSHDEPWMINLGRGIDNDWLTGPRDDDWFTGIHPRDCPGKAARARGA